MSVTAYTKAGADAAIAEAVAKVPAPPDISGLETVSHAAATYQLKGDYVTAESVDQKLAAIPATDLSGYVQDADLDGYAKKTDIPDVSGFAEKSALSAYALASAIPDVSGLATKAEVTSGLAAKADASALSGYQPKGDYVTSGELSSGLATKANADTLAGYTKTDATDALTARVAALEAAKSPVVVLGASDPVPDGTAADAVIVRVQ